MQINQKRPYIMPIALKDKAVSKKLLQKETIIEIIVALHVLLFCYTAVSKLLDFENFKNQLSQSPFVGKWSNIISWGLPTLEICIAVALTLKKWRIIGLYCAVFLMSLFTGYVYAMLKFSFYLPCSCGGILNSMSWKTHLWFNFTFVLLGIIALKIAKQRIAPILYAISTAISSITILTWISLKENDTPGSNSVRSFSFSEPILLNSAKIPAHVTNIAGISNNYFYFKTSDPSILVASTQDLSHFDSLKLPLDDLRIRKVVGNFTTFVDSPTVRVFTGNLSSLFTVQLNQKYRKQYIISSSLYSRVVPISKDSYVIRSFEGINPIFMKINTATQTTVKEHNISPKDNDAGLSTDGLLHHDKATGLIVYINYYNNNVICMDTSLRLIRRFRTIDSSTMKIKTGEVQSRGIITALGPKKLVNASSDVANGLLLNYSMVRTAKENPRSVNDNAVIDLYDLKEGKYVASIHLPKYQGERLKMFKVYNSKLVAIYKSNVVTYDLGQILHK